MQTSMLTKNAHRIALVCAGVLLAFHTAQIQPWALDDAFISYRYAENFSQGKGIVFNEGERVEGYTNFLWVFILGVGHRLGADTLGLSKVLGVAFAFSTLALVAHAHVFIPDTDRRISAIAVGLLGTSGIFTGWASSGMETPMVAFWITLALLLHLRARGGPGRLASVYGSALSCVLATMSRPECGLVFCVLFLDHLVRDIRTRQRTFIHFAAVFTTAYAPYFIWRYTYYGWLLPNTFYTKVGSTWDQVLRGFRYLRKFLAPAWLLGLTILAGPFVLKDRGRTYVSMAALPGVLVLHTLYVIAVGGDVMPAFRFFATVMPLVCLLAALTFRGLLDRPRVALTLVVVLLVFNVYETGANYEIDRLGKGPVAQLGREVGLWLREHAHPYAVIATNNAGSIPYYSGLKIIDMLGLNDEHIAHRDMPFMGQGRPGHEKGDGKYVLSREPDFIQFESSLGSVAPHFPSDKEISRDPRFDQEYEVQTYPLPSGNTLVLYTRKGTTLRVPREPVRDR